MSFFGFFNTKNDDKKECEEEIKREIDFSNFELISEYIYKKSGITDLDKRALVFTRLKQFAQDSKVFNTSEFLNKMKENEEFYQEVINIVTVNETYFFRETNELEWLVEYVKNSTTNLNIVSIPSSSGEETYTILIMLDMAGVDITKIQINGYDINTQAVKDAQNGYYNAHSLHKIDDSIKENYFTKTSSNLYQISQKFRDKARFTQKNIFELTNEENKFDIVISRNMFIYFDMKKRLEAIDVIAKILKTNGIYIKGHADHIEVHPKLENIKFGIYRKV